MVLRILFVLSTLLSLLLVPGHAQNAAKDINRIKRDTMYIYAEVTMKDLDEAYSGARAILEMKVGEWLRGQHPKDSIELCIVKAKEHFMELQTRRGNFYRTFVYVRKSDIMPVEDKRDIAVFEVGHQGLPDAKGQNSTFAELDAPVSATSEVPAAEPSSAIVLTAEENRMKQISGFHDIKPYIDGLKSKGIVRRYGKYATMPREEACHLFVYNKNGDICALIRKTADRQYNLHTLQEDNIKNYKNCGAIWFQLKEK